MKLVWLRIPLTTVNKIVRGKILILVRDLAAITLGFQHHYVCHLRQGETVESIKKKKVPCFFEWDLRSNLSEECFCFHANSFGGDDQEEQWHPCSKSKTHWTQHWTTMVLHSHLGWRCRWHSLQILTASLAYESWTSLPSILHDEVGIWYSWSGQGSCSYNVS